MSGCITTDYHTKSNKHVTNATFAIGNCLKNGRGSCTTDSEYTFAASEHTSHRKSERRRCNISRPQEVVLVIEGQPSLRCHRPHKQSRCKVKRRKSKNKDIRQKTKHLGTAETASSLRDMLNGHHHTSANKSIPFQHSCITFANSSSHGIQLASASHQLKIKSDNTFGVLGDALPANAIASGTVSAPPIAKINPIFLWVKQDGTRIIEVRCEDYDKRNRIRITKTSNGWKAMPRTDPTTTKVGMFYSTPHIEMKCEISELNQKHSCCLSRQRNYHFSDALNAFNENSTLPSTQLQLYNNRSKSLYKNKIMRENRKRFLKCLSYFNSHRPTIISFKSLSNSDDAVAYPLCNEIITYENDKRNGKEQEISIGPPLIPHHDKCRKHLLTVSRPSSPTFHHHCHHPPEQHSPSYEPEKICLIEKLKYENPNRFGHPSANFDDLFTSTNSNYGNISPVEIYPDANTDRKQNTLMPTIPQALAYNSTDRYSPMQSQLSNTDKDQLLADNDLNSDGDAHLKEKIENNNHISHRNGKYFALCKKLDAKDLSDSNRNAQNAAFCCYKKEEGCTANDDWINTIGSNGNMGNKLDDVFKNFLIDELMKYNNNNKASGNYEDGKIQENGEILQNDYDEPAKKRLRNCIGIGSLEEISNSCSTGANANANDSKPLAQLKLLLKNAEYNVPDPILIPKERLRAVLEAPALEIPLLMTTRPELRLPEAFAYPDIIQNPNILVISMAQLIAILSNDFEFDNLQSSAMAQTSYVLNNHHHQNKSTKSSSNTITSTTTATTSTTTATALPSIFLNDLNDDLEVNQIEKNNPNALISHGKLHDLPNADPLMMSVSNQLLLLPYFKQIRQNLMGNSCQFDSTNRLMPINERNSQMIYKNLLECYPDDISKINAKHQSYIKDAIICHHLPPCQYQPHVRNCNSNISGSQSDQQLQHCETSSMTNSFLDMPPEKLQESQNADFTCNISNASNTKFSSRQMIPQSNVLVASTHSPGGCHSNAHKDRLAYEPSDEITCSNLFKNCDYADLKANVILRSVQTNATTPFIYKSLTNLLNSESNNRNHHAANNSLLSSFDQMSNANDVESISKANYKEFPKASYDLLLPCNFSSYNNTNNNNNHNNNNNINSSINEFTKHNNNNKGSKIFNTNVVINAINGIAADANHSMWHPFFGR